MIFLLFALFTQIQRLELAETATEKKTWK